MRRARSTTSRPSWLRTWRSRAPTSTPPPSGDDAAVPRFLDPDRAGNRNGDPTPALRRPTSASRENPGSIPPVPPASSAPQALLDAGASPNTGWFGGGHQRTRIWRAFATAPPASPIIPLTQRLLAHGAHPNDDEIPYHSPDSDDNSALQLL